MKTNSPTCILLLILNVVILSDSVSPQNRRKSSAPPPSVVSPSISPNASVFKPSIGVLTEPRISEDAKAPSGWKRYNYEAQRFSILFPVAPESEVKQVPSGRKQPINAYYHTSTSNDGSVYMTLVMEDLPFIAEKLTVDFKNEMYRQLWKGLVQGFQEAIQENGLLYDFDTEAGESNTTLSGLPAREKKFSFGTFQGRTVATMLGQRVYVVVSMSLERDSQNLASDFIKSFQLQAK